MGCNQILRHFVPQDDKKGRIPQDDKKEKVEITIRNY